MIHADRFTSLCNFYQQLFTLSHFHIFLGPTRSDCSFSFLQVSCGDSETSQPRPTVHVPAGQLTGVTLRPVSQLPPSGGSHHNRPSADLQRWCLAHTFEQQLEDGCLEPSSVLRRSPVSNQICSQLPDRHVFWGGVSFLSGFFFPPPIMWRITR